MSPRSNSHRRITDIFNLVVGSCQILSKKLPDFIGSDGNSLEVVEILGIVFRMEVVGYRKVLEFRNFDTFQHPITSCRNPILRIRITSDKFPSDSIG